MKAIPVEVDLVPPPLMQFTSNLTYPKTANQRVKGPFPKLPSVKATSVKTTSSAKKVAGSSTDTAES